MNRPTEAAREGKFKSPRRVPFSWKERTLLLHCIRIAAEDGSIFGTAEPGEREFEKIHGALVGMIVKLAGTP